MRGRLTAGILVGLVGLVWIGQGLGIIRNQSFMVDDIRWSVVGVTMVAIGGGLAFSGWRSIRTRP
jgi:hypothetical protein